MYKKIIIFLFIGIFFLSGCFEDDKTSDAKRDYSFDTQISEQVLNNYLSRAVSHQVLFTDGDEELLADDIRMFGSIGAKFIGRASIIWQTPDDLELFFSTAKSIASQVHEMDGDIIIQAGLFEIVDEGVNQIAIPAWVFEEFNLSAQNRNYNYQEMLYENQEFVDFYGSGASIPDISRLETRLWYFHRAKLYIDAGYEAIHFGIADVISVGDLEHEYFLDLLERIRKYAKNNARRHLVLCDVHHKTGWVKDGKTMFDFLGYPLRIEESANEPFFAELKKDGEDTIYDKPLGGLTPSGWSTDSLPYLVEFDNWGSSGNGGENIGGIWIWGWDEISWFARLSEENRNNWLEYAFEWVKENTTNGYLQFPTRRILADPINERYYWYFANAPSESCENGFNQEGKIKKIWEINP